VVDAVGKDLAGLPAEAELRRVIAAVRSTPERVLADLVGAGRRGAAVQTLIVGRGVIGIGAFA
jgi:hypothetical protein